MSYFDSLTAIPSQITAGEVVTWTETIEGYSSSTHTLAYKFFGDTPLDGVQQFAIAASTSGDGFSLSTASTYKPGRYRWEKQLTQTSGSVMRVIGTGEMIVAPNLATTQTVSFAATQVALLQTVIASFNGNNKASVSFNGQSYSRESISSYQDQLNYWRGEVAREQAAWRALMGGASNSGRIAQVFV